MRKIAYSVIIASLIAALLWLGFFSAQKRVFTQDQWEPIETEELLVARGEARRKEDETNEETRSDATVVAENVFDTPLKNVLSIQNVPFSAQAPFGEWNDPLHQNGCEEVSLLMVVRWAEGSGIGTPAEAKEAIRDLAFAIEKRFGTYHDTSSSDLFSFLRSAYPDLRASYVEGVTLERIKDALRSGGVVIVPMDGRALGNPNYTAPGPERHMLVAIGYDSEMREIVTNGPGTRRGAEYRYGEDIFFAAIRDYPTGDNLPIRTVEKNAIIIRKERFE